LKCMLRRPRADRGPACARMTVRATESSMATPQSKWATVDWVKDDLSELELRRFKKEAQTRGLAARERDQQIMLINLRLLDLPSLTASESASLREEAIVVGRRLLAAEPDNETHIVNLSAVLLPVATEEARALLNAALERASTSFEMRANLIDAQARVGDLDGLRCAVRLAEQYAATDDGDHQFRLAHALAVAGYDDEAVSRLFRYATLTGRPCTLDDVEDQLRGTRLTEPVLMSLANVRRRAAQQQRFEQAMADPEMIALAADVAPSAAAPDPAWVSRVAASIVDG
jgi:hypothetical protein